MRKNTGVRHEELLIGGHFFGGPCDQSVAKSVVRSPFHGQTVGTAAEAGWTEASAAVEAAAHAFTTWRRSTRSERSELLSAIQRGIESRIDELAELMADEIGKPITLAKGELMRCGLTFGLAAELAQTYGKETVDVTYDPRDRGHRVQAFRFPLGPILAITPYNWPFNLAAHKLAPALAMGNTIVLKGSEQAALSTLAFGRLIHEAGCPPGVVNVIQTDGATAERMAKLEAIRMVSFTGSAAVGWHLRRALPEKRLALELGGDAYVLLAEDADLDEAIPKTAQSAFGYAGQVCISAQHVLAHESILDDVRERLVEATRNVKTGDPRDPDVVCGPVMSLREAERILGWIHEASAAGGRILVGGQANGTLVDPTLVENVPPTVRMGCEEVFGPVLTLQGYSTLDEAIARVNAGAYGIHASLFTANESAVQRAMQDLEVAGLILNDPPSLRFDAMPYGGVKRSGLGREGVRYAMDEMSEIKVLVRAPGRNINSS